MPVLAGKAVFWAGATAVSGFMYLISKEGADVAESVTTAVKWGVVGGVVYVVAKGAKVI